MLPEIIFQFLEPIGRPRGVHDMSQKAQEVHDARCGEHTHCPRAHAAQPWTSDEMFMAA